MDGNKTQDDVIYEQLIKPAFVEKCASLGLTFSSDEEVEEAIKGASMVQMAKNSAKNGVVKEANAQLRKHLNLPEETQPAVQTKAAGVTPQLKQALLADLLG